GRVGAFEPAAQFARVDEVQQRLVETLDLRQPAPRLEPDVAGVVLQFAQLPLRDAQHPRHRRLADLEVGPDRPDATGKFRHALSLRVIARGRLARAGGSAARTFPGAGTSL